MTDFATPLFVFPFVLAAFFIANLGNPPWDKSLLCAELLLAGLIGWWSSQRLFEKRGPLSQTWAPYCLGGAAILFLLLCFSLNLFVLILAPFAFASIPAFFYTKRFAPWHRWGTEIALGLLPLFFWVAVQGTLSFISVLLALAVIAWIIGSDWLQEPPFAKAASASRLLHGVFLLFLLLFGFLAGFGISYLVLMSWITVLIYWQHRLLRQPDFRYRKIAFGATHGLIGFFFFAWTLLELHLPYLLVTVP